MTRGLSPPMGRAGSAHGWRRGRRVGRQGLVAARVTRRLIAEFARSSPSLPAPVELGELTNRELTILGLIARGLSNAEIGRELFVSPSTVKTHIGNLLGKLGCRDRVQAVIYAYEHGVVRPGDRL
jgi:DNA-binding NarL/FixJ family response regulator